MGRRHEEHPLGVENLLIKGTGDLIKAELIANPWIARFRAQNIQMDISSRFLNPDSFPEGTHLDPLTGLPLEKGAMRLKIIKKFSESIRDKKKWAVIYRDLDQLKVANDTHGKPFGNGGIIAEISRGSHALDELGLENVTTYITRQTDAADEAVMYLFGLTDVQLAALQRMVVNQNNSTTVLTDPSYTFSSSLAMITSEDETVQIQQEKARSALIQRKYRDAYAFDMFNDVKQTVDDQTKTLKLAKDIARLPVNEATQARNVKDVINIFTNTLGGSRISKDLLRTLLTIVHNETNLARFVQPYTIDQLLDSMGLPEITDQILNPEQIRTLYYQRVIEEIQEQLAEQR